MAAPYEDISDSDEDEDECRVCRGPAEEGWVKENISIYFWAVQWCFFLQQSLCMGGGSL